MIAVHYGLGFRQCLDLLFSRLAEPAPSRIQLLARPRQVGKTTLLLELLDRFREKALCVAADGPEAALPGFWQRLWIHAEEMARTQGRAVVLLDEAHLLTNWAACLKGEWDRVRRRKLPLQIVATGYLRFTSGLARERVSPGASSGSPSPIGRRPLWQRRSKYRRRTPWIRLFEWGPTRGPLAIAMT